MLRLIAVMAFVIACYYFPSSYSMETLTVGKIEENAAHSFYLCVAISLIWKSWKCLWIVCIETILVVCDAYTKHNMPSGGIFNQYYSLLHESAYLLELAIMFAFIAIEWRKCGNIQGTIFHRNLFNRNTNSNSTGDSN